MKKIILLLVVIFSFVSCDLVVNKYNDIRLSDIPLSSLVELGIQEEIKSILLNCETIDEQFKAIGGFLGSNITWVTGIYTPVQSPLETWTKKTGNCEDFSVLFNDIAYFALGIKVEIVSVNIDDMEIIRTIENGGTNINHDAVRYNGTIYEPQNGYKYTVTVGYSYSFDEVFN